MIYRFRDYELNTQLFELRSAGTPLQLEPKVFDLLAHLICYRDRVVTKQQLLTHFWPQQFVRGYPETCQHCRAFVKPPSCGNEIQDDRMERVCSASDGCY